MERYQAQQELRVTKTLGIDLDNFIMDTPQYHELYIGVCHSVAGINPDDIEAERHEIEKQQKSFHTDSTVIKLLETMDKNRVRDDSYMSPERYLDAIHVSMVKLCEDPEVRETLYKPGAKAFIETLNREGAFARGEAFVLTHGVESSQLTKIASLGLSDLLCVITDDVRKGVLAGSWRLNDTYVIPTRQGVTIIADEFALGDDKTVSFRKFPDFSQKARGFLIPVEGRASSKGDIPDNVEKIVGFEPLLRYLGFTAIKI